MTTEPQRTATAGAALRPRDLALALLLAVFCYANAWVWIPATPPGIPPDEFAHLTYIHEIAVEGRLLPDYEGSRRLPGRVQANYLNHPPLYYTTMGLAGRAMGWDPMEHYRAYRALSAAFVALGMLLWILTGRVLGLSGACLVAITAAVNAVPMFSYLAGSVNNDNLAFLGVAIAFHGLVRLRQWSPHAYYVAAAGVAIAMLTKATAALFLCACFVFWALPQLRDPASPIRSRHFWRAMLAAGVLVGAYYAAALVMHGSVFPVATEIYSERSPAADPLGLVPFALKFVELMLRRLPSVMSFGPLNPITPGLRPLFYLMLALPVAAWLFHLRTAQPHPMRNIANAFMLGLLATVVVHVCMVWSGYLQHGLFAAMQPRYYNYALPGLFVLGFLAVSTSRLATWFFACFALAAVVMVVLAPALTVRAEAERVAAARAQPQVQQTIRVPAAPDAGGLELQVGLSRVRAGNVDVVSLGAGTARVAGWAIERSDRSPARGVVVLLGDRMVGRVATGTSRPDVANALKARTAQASGFRAMIEGLPAGTTACDLRFAAEQGDGTFAMLPSAACPAGSAP